MRRSPRINRFGVIMALALGASASAFLVMPVAGQAAVPDAYCSGPPTNVAGFGDSDGGRWGETFSPINGGYLAEVRLFVQEELHLNDTLTVRITQVNGSDLSPVFPVVPIATSTVPDSSLTPSGSYPYLTEVAFDFSNPPAVSASSEYAIVLTRSNASGVLGIGIVGFGSSGDPCPDGALYDASGGPSDPWSAADTHHDAVFTTFVNSAPTPAPSAPSPAPPPQPQAAKCNVPKLAGKKLKAAKKAIRTAHCSVGTVTKKNDVTAKTGTVVNQSPNSGKTLAPGTKVKVTLG